MMNDDLKHTLGEMRANRERLLALIRRLSDDDLDRARRGGWTVRRVIEHVIESEATYVKVLAHLCGRTASSLPDRDVDAVAAAVEKLEATRTAVLAMIDGIDDDTLYRLVVMGREEYSPLSMLENVAAHDHEHEEQIQRLVSKPA